MKQLLEFFPLIVFFACYKFYDIYIASAALIGASALQIVALKLLYKHVEKVQIISFAMICVFGSLTYFLHDDAFIKWKVTIINALFALALFVGEVIRKPILKALLGQHLPVEGSAWSKISWLWIGFFLLCAWLNWYIAFFMSQDTWVNFKVFGLMGMSLAMTAVTVFYLYKHLPEEKRREFKK